MRRNNYRNTVTRTETNVVAQPWYGANLLERDPAAELALNAQGREI